MALSWKQHFIGLAHYHCWANEVLFKSLDTLPAAALAANEGLFFGSALHTLNHILVGTRIWFGRLRHEDPKALQLNTVLYSDWTELKQALRDELQAVLQWLERQPERAFEEELAYTNTRGEPFRNTVSDVLTHLFSHIQHHRGQVSVAATRLGAPAPEMDFIFWRRAQSAKSG
jgi:uncharacterized damage-inducible protein DinB